MNLKFIKVMLIWMKIYLFERIFIIRTDFILKKSRNLEQKCDRLYFSANSRQLLFYTLSIRVQASESKNIEIQAKGPS